MGKSDAKVFFGSFAPIKRRKQTRRDRRTVRGACNFNLLLDGKAKELGEATVTTESFECERIRRTHSIAFILLGFFPLPLGLFAVL